MIIDFHTHCFPDALAPKALGKLSAAAGSTPCTDGMASGSIKKMKVAGIDLSVVCNIATNPHQQHKVNNFAVALNDRCPELIALGSLSPDSEDIEEELDYLYDHDIHGIKIHPEYASYYIDSPEWERIFAACADRNMFIVTHAGYDFISPDRIAVTPARLAKMLDKFPSLRIVAAHLGGNRLWNEVCETLCGRDNLWLDTALIAREGISPEAARMIIDKHGHNRILFGSDMPWSEPNEELNFVRSLGFSEKSLELILEKNAEELLR